MTTGSMKHLIVIEGTAVRETPLSVFGDFGDEQVYLPKSQLEDWPDMGEFGEFLMPEWLAYEKELI